MDEFRVAVEVGVFNCAAVHNWDSVHAPKPISKCEKWFDFNGRHWVIIWSTDLRFDHHWKPRCLPAEGVKILWPIGLVIHSELAIAVVATFHKAGWVNGCSVASMQRCNCNFSYFACHCLDALIRVCVNAFYLGKWLIRSAVGKRGNLAWKIGGVSTNYFPYSKLLSLWAVNELRKISTSRTSTKLLPRVDHDWSHNTRHIIEINCLILWW